MARRKPHAPDARGQILAAGVRVLRTESLTQTRVAREARVSQCHLTYDAPQGRPVIRDFLGLPPTQE